MTTSDEKLAEMIREYWSRHGYHNVRLSRVQAKPRFSVDVHGLGASDAVNGRRRGYGVYAPSKRRERARETVSNLGPDGLPRAELTAQEIAQALDDIHARRAWDEIPGLAAQIRVGLQGPRRTVTPLVVKEIVAEAFGHGAGALSNTNHDDEPQDVVRAVCAYMMRSRLSMKWHEVAKQLDRCPSTLRKYVRTVEAHMRSKGESGIRAAVLDCHRALEALE